MDSFPETLKLIRRRVPRPRSHVPGYSWKLRFFSPFSKKVRVHTWCIRIVFAPPHEIAQTMDIRKYSLGGRYEELTAVICIHRNQIQNL